MLEKIKTGFVKARLDLVVRVVNKKYQWTMKFF